MRVLHILNNKLLNFHICDIKCNLKFLYGKCTSKNRKTSLHVSVEFFLADQLLTFMYWAMLLDIKTVKVMKEIMSNVYI